MRGGIRAGSVIRSGPTGAPPPQARIFESGSAAPGALIRHDGAFFYDRETDEMWIRASAAGTWQRVDELGFAASMAVTCSAGVDPSVTGLAAPVGATCYSKDNVSVWYHYGAGDYDWRSLNETRAAVTAAGGPLAALDLTVSVPADRAVAVSVAVSSTIGGNWCPLRLNGATATLVAGYLLCGGGAVPIGSSPLFVLIGSGGPSQARLRIGKSQGGVRMVSVDFVYASSTYCGFAVLSVTAGALTSVGMAAGAGTQIENGSVISATVADFDGGKP